MDVEKIALTPEQESLLAQQEKARQFAEAYSTFFATQLARQEIVNRERNNNAKTSFSSYQRSDVVSWLKSPETSGNAKNLRNASIYMFMRSPQYRRLCLHNAMTPRWAYTLSPVGYDPNKTKADTLRKQYFKAAAMLENMNLKHEMQKATTIAWVEGVMYGLILSSSNSFFIQRVDPNLCTITSVLDGVYTYSIDVSQIREEDLVKYPEIITKMRNDYVTSGIKLQEVPPEYSFCIKIDEAVPSFTVPPFAATLPYLYDIDSYINLMADREDLKNYKALSMKLPVDEYGVPTVEEPLVEKYYAQIANNLPDQIGLLVAPFDIKDWDFQKANSKTDDDLIVQAEEHFWSASGTTYLLFGSPKNNTSRGIELSIGADQNVMFAVMNQCERLINRYLKYQGSAGKFKITFLPVTEFNWKEVLKEYTTLATYGVPVKAAMCAIAGLQPADIPGMDFIEKEILKMVDLTPLASSHTQSASPGRPSNEDKGEPLSDAGEQTADDDENVDRA